MLFTSPPNSRVTRIPGDGTGLRPLWHRSRTIAAPVSTRPLLVTSLIIAILALAVSPGRALAGVAVATIAGSGAPGYRDGTSSAATFMEPFGLASDGRGNLYVADAAAQRIRMISPGLQVTTVAGSGSPLEGGLGVAGGFRDGPAAQAQFNDPSAIAVGRDGTIYVADSLNNCIRAIANGSVSTFAGRPGNAGNLAGARDSAEFFRPKGLAFDDEGNLYVADWTVGLRKISPAGDVSTVALPEAFGTTVTGVAAWGGGKSLVLFVAGRSGLLRLEVATGATAVIDGVPKDDSTFDIEGAHPAGIPYSVVATGPTDAIYTDMRAHVLRQVFFGNRIVKTIGKAPREDAAASEGGFADGTAFEFDEPVGLAPLPNGAIAVADAGNRRIRRVDGIVTRHAASSFDELVSALDVSDRFYRIVLLGNSFAYYDRNWDDSIPGIIEARLNRDRVALGIPKPVKVICVRPFYLMSQVDDYVQQLLTSDRADMVILQFNTAFVNARYDKALTDSVLNITPASQWESELTGQLLTLRGTLEAERVPLLLVLQPFPGEVSPVEMLWLRETLVNVVYPEYVRVHAALLASASAAGLDPLDLWPAFLAVERSPNRYPLFSARDFHFSDRGNALAAGAITEQIEQRKPWLKGPTGSI